MMTLTLPLSLIYRNASNGVPCGRLFVVYTGIQLRVEDSLCEVDPDDVLSDLVPNDGQVIWFVSK